MIRSKRQKEYLGRNINCYVKEYAKVKMETEEGQEGKKLILNHQLEEWKCLNEYINSMDMGYHQSFVIMVSIFAGVTALFTGNFGTKELMKVIFIVPLGLVAFFSYISYQFRITAILRGHLAALEEKMNEELGEDVHMWNSALTETYMANNNSINNFMMIPIMFFIFLLVIYCGFLTWKALLDVPYAIVIYVVYWTLVAVGAAIVFPPFLKNDDVRHKTYNEKRVMEMYKNYRTTWSDNENHNVIDKCSRKKNRTLVKSIFAGIVNAILGFGVMCIFWQFSDKSSGLKGLFDYYAATIGDAVFLSILIGTGWYYIESNRDKVFKNSNHTINWLCIIAAAIGLLIQASWLINPNTGLNWTINRAHHFNAAGWYHAVYFIMMFCLITRIVSNAVYLNSKGNLEAKGCYIAMWLAGMGYWYTHVIDDYLTDDNYRIWIISSMLLYWIVFAICEGKHIKSVKNRCWMYIGLITGSLILAGTVWTFCMVGGLGWNVLELIDQLNQVLK